MTNSELQKILRRYSPDKEVELYVRFSDSRGGTSVSIDMTGKFLAANTYVNPEKVTLYLVEGEEQ